MLLNQSVTQWQAFSGFTFHFLLFRLHGSFHPQGQELGPSALLSLAS